MALDFDNLPNNADVLRQMVIELATQLEASGQDVQDFITDIDRDREAKAGDQNGKDDPPAAGTSADAKPRGHGRKPLPRTLKRERIEYDLDEAERQCPCCAQTMRRIGEELSERLEYVPASLKVIEEARAKYACSCGGVELSRKTMCGWMRQTADLLAPLYERLKEQALASKVVQTDDTPVAVLDRALPKTRTGRIWTYVGDRDHGATVYDYTATRKREGPDLILKEYRGYLQADAYAGYDHLYKDPERGIVEVGCWAHSRRKMYEARTSDMPRAMTALAYIGWLYKIERKARGLSNEDRLALRQRLAVPVLAELRVWLERERVSVLPKSPFGAAVGYPLSNWAALCRYCEDGGLAIDNNGAERSLRGVAVGRRNWTFFGSDQGGRTAAILTSFVATCQRHKIDPFAYLRDVLGRVAEHPITKLDELLPANWTPVTA